MMHPREAMFVRTAAAVSIALTACSSASIHRESPPVAEVSAAPAPVVPATAVAPPVAATPAPVVVSAAPPRLASAAAWTEATAIDALAVDCAVAAPALEDESMVSPLACTLLWEQSCAYDPCFFKQSDCKVDCGKTCGSCEAACTSTCSSCKTSCAAGAAGDACRRACASTTGSCRQACLAHRDKCATADCTSAAEVCGKHEIAAWKKNGCTGVCPKYLGCWNDCQEKNEGERERGACQKACAKGISPKCDLNYCLMGGAPEPNGRGD